MDLVLLQSKLPDVRAALPPRTIEAEALEVAFRAAFNKNPKLTECTDMSLCAALVNCAMLGLIPNTPEQHAYLIPRRQKAGNDYEMVCEVQIGYRGFVHMILRGGEVSHIDSGIIHKGDKYELQKGDPVICWTQPDLENSNRDAAPIIAAYCLIAFKSGAKRLEVMDGADLAKIEKAMMRANAGKMTPAWSEWRSEMLRKAPIKRAAKTCNLGPLIAQAAEMDNAAFQRLPAAEPRALTLPDGGTLPVLPRHEPRQIADAEPAMVPANDEPEFGTPEGDAAPELRF